MPLPTDLVAKIHACVAGGQCPPTVAPAVSTIAQSRCLVGQGRSKKDAALQAATTVCDAVRLVSPEVATHATTMGRDACCSCTWGS